MGYIDHVFLDTVAHLGQLGAHLAAQLGIEVRQGFIKQERARITDQGTAHGNALTLAARQFGGLARQKMADVQHVGHTLHFFVNLGLGCLGQAQGKGHVPRDVHMRVKRVILKHHRDVALFGLKRADGFAVEINLSARQGFEPRKNAQSGGFPAAGRAHQHGEFPVVQRKIKRRQHPNRAIALFDTVKDDFWHKSPPQNLSS
mmetsp:Transcript_18173/g.28431  ORF Transcript_18173/g.28431 Transcript_18173/m.28431 type:complete len:202 (+) Transcript_18173:253-858(+)